MQKYCWHFLFPGIIQLTRRYKHLLLEELVSLSAEEVYTILCLPAMSQEHVLNAPLVEGITPRQTFAVKNSHKALHAMQSLQCFAIAGTSFRAAVQQLAATLKRVEVFYDSIGGLLGYQRKCLQIMLESSEQQADAIDPTSVAAGEVTFHMPQGPDLAGPNGRQLAAESSAAGLEALPHMAEIYPLGGEELLLCGMLIECCSCLLLIC